MTELEVKRLLFEHRAELTSDGRCPTVFHVDALYFRCVRDDYHLGPCQIVAPFYEGPRTVARLVKE